MSYIHIFFHTLMLFFILLYIQRECCCFTLNRKNTQKKFFLLFIAVFYAVILVSSSITWQLTYSTVATSEPSAYMNGQRIATYEEMGINSLLSKYENNSLDPVVLINDIYDRIDLNEATDKNPILISKVSRNDTLERINELKELRSNLPAGVDLSDRYPLWGIPFVVKDIIDVKGMETTVGSANWTKFPNCVYPPVEGLPGYSNS